MVAFGDALEPDVGAGELRSTGGGGEVEGAGGGGGGGARRGGEEAVSVASTAPYGSGETEERRVTIV